MSDVDKDLPGFLKYKDGTAYYNGDGELIYYIPEEYFTDTKNPIAMVVGQFISTFGIFDWALVSANGKISESKPFRYPTIIMCKPSYTEKQKGVSLNGTRHRDYRVLHFKNGDEAISNVNTPEIIDNVLAMLKMSIVNGNKLPSTIPYDKLHEYFPENMALNGSSYNLNMQLFGIMVSESCRDPKDLTKPFRLSKSKDMIGYAQVSIKQLPNYANPYVSLTSENFDESLMASILLSDAPEEDLPTTPLEKVFMA